MRVTVPTGLRREQWPVAAAAVIVVVPAACSAVAAGQERTVLRVVMADDWASAPAVTEVISDVEEDHAGLSVMVQAAPFSQIPEVVGDGIHRGEPHDLARWHAFAAAAADLAEPLDDLWRDAGLEPADYLPGAVSGITWGGQRYGVPWTPTRWSCWSTTPCWTMSAMTTHR